MGNVGVGGSLDLGLGLTMLNERELHCHHDKPVLTLKTCEAILATVPMAQA